MENKATPTLPFKGAQVFWVIEAVQESVARTLAVRMIVWEC